MGWQWHQLDHMQIICMSLQTDNNASTSPLSFYRPDALPAAQPTASKHWRWDNTPKLLGQISELLGHYFDPVVTQLKRAVPVGERTQDASRRAAGADLTPSISGRSPGALTSEYLMRLRTCVTERTVAATNHGRPSSEQTMMSRASTNRSRW